VQAVVVSCQEPRSAWRDAGPAAGDSPQPSTRADEPRPLHQAAFHPVKVKIRPGASATAHPRRRTAEGRHRPRAQRGTSCCAVTGTSSAALRGGICFASSHFSMNPHIHVSSTTTLPPATACGACIIACGWLGILWKVDVSVVQLSVEQSQAATLVCSSKPILASFALSHPGMAELPHMSRCHTRSHTHTHFVILRNRAHEDIFILALSCVCLTQSPSRSCQPPWPPHMQRMPRI
jgi:hypothetical protein